MITLARNYDPYGTVTSTGGTSSTAYGFTGETTDANGLVYLRARYYSSGAGRFLSRDTWGGDTNRPLSLNRWMYVEGNPVNRIDPSGYSYLGPTNMVMCFNLSAILEITQWDWHGTSARLAVEICQMAYNKYAWNIKSSNRTPQTTQELWAWYLNESGTSNHLYFIGSHRLTRELAKSILIHDVRRKFYLNGDIKQPELYRFNIGEIVASSIYDSRISPFSITQFIGSFWYQVVRLPGQRIGFRIDNDTTLESGTHFAGRFPDDGFGGSVEELINSNPSLADQPLDKVMRENPVISILQSRTREGTSDPLGGGDAYQTFTWSEEYNECFADLMPWQVFESLIDIKVWSDFKKYTQPVFEH